MFANGSGEYHVPGISAAYTTNWYVQRSGDGYRLFEYGFWHPAYNGLGRDRLTYPLTVFKTYANFDPNFVSQEYIKN